MPPAMLKDMLKDPAYRRRLQMGPFEFDSHDYEQKLGHVEGRPISFEEEGHVYLG